MKKWKILALSALCISCLSVATACKEKETEKTNALVGFVDETVEIELGDIISVHDFLKVYDEDGNLYSATFELTDSIGNNVSLLKNEFTVEDTIGYTLVLNARDPKTGDIIATRTVQLKTVDKSAPIIAIGDLVDYGVVGDEIQVPLIFDDASQNYTTSVTVMRLPYRLAANGYDESIAETVATQYTSKGELATFTPVMQGRHKIIVEAWDGTDKEAAKTASVYNVKEAYLDVKTSDLEIEGFDLPDSLSYSIDKVNCYTVYGANETNKKGDKTLAGNSVEWHDVFEGKEGVVSMKPAKTVENYGGVYYVGSSSRTRKFQEVVSGAASDIPWDYVSMWIYIPGTQGETVKVSGNYGYGARQVPFNTWYEYRVYKDYFNKVAWGRTNYTLSTTTSTSWDHQSMLFVGNGTDADYTVYLDTFSYVYGEDAMNITVTGNGDNGANISVTPKAGYQTLLADANYYYYVHTYKDNGGSGGQRTVTNGTFTYDNTWTTYWIGVRVEIDGVVYSSDCMHKAYVKEISVEKVTGEKKAQISATMADGITDEVTFTVTAPNGTTLPVSSERIFDTETEGTYVITATGTHNGETFTCVKNYTVGTSDLMSDLEIEGFYTAECLEYDANNVASGMPAIYGGANHSGDKTVAANNAAWYETYQGRNGVVSMTSAHTSTYGSAYYVGSSTRPRTFHQNTSGVAADIEWDYISMWIYIAKPAGATTDTVKVSGHYDWGQREVPYDTWYEYRVYKEYFNLIAWGRPEYCFSYKYENNSYQKSMLYVGEANDTLDYTVYIDTLSYAYAEDAMDIEVTNNGNNTVSVNATPKTGYETTLENATFTYYVHAYQGTTQKGKINPKNDVYTYKTEYTSLWICVRVEVDGVSYMSDIIYTIPTA